MIFDEYSREFVVLKCCSSVLVNVSAYLELLMISCDYFLKSLSLNSSEVSIFSSKGQNSNDGLFWT
jgi:hypothetical protein